MSVVNTCCIDHDLGEPHMLNYVRVSLTGVTVPLSRIKTEVQSESEHGMVYITCVG